MDKNAIKKFAVWARRELISRVSQRAAYYGITEAGYGDLSADKINGRVLSTIERKQRDALIRQIQSKGYEEVMEEVAYTWFNRFSALRFMEVNGYLPSHVRVFSDEDNRFQPQILAEAIHMELEGLDIDKVFELKDTNQTEELYKYLLIVQCNALNEILPKMFQKIGDYTELLFPENLLREGSVIEQMITLIPEEDWQDQVQIIGWLYQYYNSEKKDEVFAALKKNVKITKENIPAATQLFTPDWIVRYMVENSLGRLWVEGHPETKDQLLPTKEEQKQYAETRENPDKKWQYFLEEAEQEIEVQAQLDEIRKEYAKINPEEIKCIDPCCGSGHILAYMFDVLVQIYEAYGYTSREAVASIVTHNIYGLDIDERAAQLANFAVMMKARQYDRRFFSRHLQPNVHAIVESNAIDEFALDYFVNGDSKLKEAMDSIIKEMYDAKEYGSILNITPVDFERIHARLEEVYDDIHMSRDAVLEEILPLVQVAEALAQKYDAVVTNPPYMGGSGMSTKLSEFVKKNYPDSKSDMFAVFIEHCKTMAKRNGYNAMITQHAWMFLSSYEKLRGKLLTRDTVNMVHLGARAFEEIGGEVVQTTSFVIANRNVKEYKGAYCRLIGPTTQQGKEDMFLAAGNRYSAKQDNFSKIPGSPVAYWVSDTLRTSFKEKSLSYYVDTRRGLQTGDSNRFIRKWYEAEKVKTDLNPDIVSKHKSCKWHLFNSGGAFRKWYGNIIDVVNWGNNGAEIKETGKAIIPSEDRYMDEIVSWNKISSGKISVRYQPAGIIPGDASPFVHSSTKNHKLILYSMAIMNSIVVRSILSVISPTLNFEVGNIAKIPIFFDTNIIEHVCAIVENCIKISKYDWDSFETSWDFKKHPLIRPVPQNEEERIVANIQGDSGVMSSIYYAYTDWMFECEDRFNSLKSNEEELNRIFIDIYGLQDELIPEVEDKDVTVRKADLTRDIKSFISYAVGCMFGRYSLDTEGLAYAGGEWDASKYTTFAADKDNIIPICDDEYFEDDIVGRFIEFVRTVYGEKTLDENLRFIADALGGKGQPKEVLRNYFLNNFFADHCKIYQKRPIYWLFDSGKKNGFKALIYMHRYQSDTIARIRTDYVHEQQSRYRTAIEDLEQRIQSASTSERVKLNKRLKTLKEQAAEIQGYEEKIHHLADQFISIDLDDGVKKNYELFKDVLAKIK